MIYLFGSYRLPRPNPTPSPASLLARHCFQPDTCIWYCIEVLIVCWQGRAEEILRAIFPSKHLNLKTVPSAATLGTTEMESSGAADPTSRTTPTDGGSRSTADVRPLRGSSSAPSGGSLFEFSGERGSGGQVAGGGAMSGVKVTEIGH